VSNRVNRVALDSFQTQPMQLRERDLAGFTAVVGALEEYAGATGRRSLSLGGWEADDPAILPPGSLVESLSQIPARLGGYTYMRELFVAKRRAAEVFAFGIRMEGQLLTPDHAAVLPNSTQALLLILAVLKDQGIDHVVVAAPGYFATIEACRHLGLSLTIISAADFLTGALDTRAILDAVRRRRSALILTNPAYCIGVEYSWSCLSSLFAALPEESLVVLDETRLGLNWHDEAPWYKADYPANVLVVRSPSKIFFINGQKTSIVLAAPRLIHRIERVSEGLLGSLAGVSEPVALAYLNCWQKWVDELCATEPGPLLRWRHNVIACFKRNRRTAALHLRRRGFSVSPVDSGPYLLACVQHAEDRRLDSFHIARTVGVLTMDSSYFFHQHRGWIGFRVNLSGRQEDITEAIARVFPLQVVEQPHPIPDDLCR
jgi:histidinol-phosphate/aromatic aminotransferase/cobyric acid decarboxylase-like protein